MVETGELTVSGDEWGRVGKKPAKLQLTIFKDTPDFISKLSFQPCQQHKLTFVPTCSACPAHSAHSVHSAHSAHSALIVDFKCIYGDIHTYIHTSWQSFGPEDYPVITHNALSSLIALVFRLPSSTLCLQIIISIMATPVEFLPPALDEDTLRAFAKSQDLPHPIAIQSLTVTAEYHSIYVLSFSLEDGKAISPSLATTPNGTVDLILRVSGQHIPRIKTENEVAVMTWVRENTTVPIPEVIRFDATPNNLLGHEFSLLERVPGKGLHEIYDHLSQEQLEGIVDQIIDILEQLHQKSWNNVGGLAFAPSSHAVVPGRVLEETFWQAPDAARYFQSESVDTLNIQGPYDSYTEYIAALIRTYQHIIGLHPSLEPMRDLQPRLFAWVNALGRHPELNDTRYVLAHKDLHMANTMYDEATGRITAILDWEFSGIVPIQRWDPSRAFLWNGQRNARAVEEQKRLRDMFEKRCEARGLQDLLDEPEYTSDLQATMQDGISYLRAIVEVCPRGQRQDKLGEWREKLEASLEAFGV